MLVRRTGIQLLMKKDVPCFQTSSLRRCLSKLRLRLNLLMKIHSWSHMFKGKETRERTRKDWWTLRMGVLHQQLVTLNGKVWEGRISMSSSALIESYVQQQMLSAHAERRCVAVSKWMNEQNGWVTIDGLSLWLSCQLGIWRWSYSHQLMSHSG